MGNGATAAYFLYNSIIISVFNSYFLFNYLLIIFKKYLLFWPEPLGACGETPTAAASILRAPHGGHSIRGRGAFRLQYVQAQHKHTQAYEHKHTSTRAYEHKHIYKHITAHASIFYARHKKALEAE